MTSNNKDSKFLHNLFTLNSTIQPKLMYCVESGSHNKLSD